MLWWIILSGTVVLALIAFAAVFAVTSLVICPRRRDLQSAFAYFGERGEEMRRTYESLQREAFSVTADDGTRLKAELVAPPCAEGRKKVVIFVHGFGFNRAAALKYLPFFQKRGFYAVLFDHRNAGESGGKHTTFGAKEQHDLRAVDLIFRSPCYEGETLDFRRLDHDGVLDVCASRGNDVVFLARLEPRKAAE